MLRAIQKQHFVNVFFKFVSFFFHSTGWHMDGYLAWCRYFKPYKIQIHFVKHTLPLSFGQTHPHTVTPLGPVTDTNACIGGEVTGNVSNLLSGIVLRKRVCDQWKKSGFSLRTFYSVWKHHYSQISCVTGYFCVRWELRGNVAVWPRFSLLFCLCTFELLSLFFLFQLNFFPTFFLFQIKSQRNVCLICCVSVEVMDVQ